MDIFVFLWHVYFSSENVFVKIDLLQSYKWYEDLKYYYLKDWAQEIIDTYSRIRAQNNILISILLFQVVFADYVVVLLYTKYNCTTA